MSFGTRVVISLVAGLAVGAIFGAVDVPVLKQVAPTLEPIGTLWLNGLRMTIVPLIVAMLITGVASAAETAATGRIAGRAMLLFLILLTAGAAFGAVFSSLALMWVPVDPAAAEAFRSGASHNAAAIPTLPGVRDWLVNVIPTNIFKSASDGEMLPLVIFSLFFGFAASRIAPELRDPLLGFFRAVMETMLVI